ncbi:hypothetical protein D3C81_170270 [compost metagenome]
MSNAIIPAEIKVSGRYRATKYDKNLCVIEETSWGKNLITGPGMDFLMGAASAGTLYLHAVAGSGNAAPSLSDSTLQAYLGKYSACQAMTVERNYTTAPYYVRITTTHRYYPGAFGASPVNIAEFGMVFSNTASNTSINGSTQIGSRALAVNGAGTPASTSIQPDEYLDQTWEWTWWIPDSALATINVEVDGTPTSTDTEARPACMGQSSGFTLCWFYPDFSPGVEPSGGGRIGVPNIFPTLNRNAVEAVSSSWAAQGPLGSAGDAIGGTFGAGLVCNTATAAAYTSGNYYRDYTFTWGLNNGNATPNVAGAQLGLRAMMWQVSYSPAILKVAGKKLELTFRLSIANL